MAVEVCLVEKNSKLVSQVSRHQWDRMGPKSYLNPIRDDNLCTGFFSAWLCYSDVYVSVHLAMDRLGNPALESRLY